MRMKRQKPTTVSGKKDGRTRPEGRGSGMSRREFLLEGGALALGVGLGSGLRAVADQTGPAHPHVAKLGWRLSVQGWTYRRFPLFEALDKASEVGLRHIEPRTILKLDAKRPDVKVDEEMPADAAKELKARLADRGMSIPSVFADFNGKPDQARRLLEFWKGFGTDIIVAEPPEGSFDMLERLCDEYKMQVAVHNHQKGRSRYWSPEEVLKVCKGRGKQIGACCDGGQWVRSGLDPVQCLRELDGRIVCFHLKDVAKKGDLNSRNTVIGEGEGECARQLAELKRLGYRGLIIIDFEHDSPSLQKDMARNIAFVEEQAKQFLAQQ